MKLSWLKYQNMNVILINLYFLIYSVSNQNFAIAYNDSLVNIWTKNIPQPYPLKLSSQPKELLFSQKSNYLLIVNNDSTLDILNIFQKQKIFHKSFTHDLKKAAFSADEDKLILAFDLLTWLLFLHNYLLEQQLNQLKKSKEG